MKRRTLFQILILILFIEQPAAYSQLSDSEAKIEIDSLMKANYPANQPGAAIFVMKDNKEFFKGAYGIGDLSASRAITPQTIFRIGSITKQFTSIGILMMVSENKLSLDDQVSTFFPAEFSKKPPITVRHLLTHTSGIVDLSEIAEARRLMTKQTPPNKLVEIIGNQDLLFPPGTKYEYSNSGYVVLGAILEKVSGQSYGEFVKRRIFEPAKMTRSFYSNRDALPR